MSAYSLLFPGRQILSDRDWAERTMIYLSPRDIGVATISIVEWSVDERVVDVASDALLISTSGAL